MGGLKVSRGESQGDPANASATDCKLGDNSSISRPKYADFGGLILVLTPFQRPVFLCVCVGFFLVFVFV